MEILTFKGNRQSINQLGIPAASTGNHHQDGLRASHALTNKSDHSGGADHVFTLHNDRTLHDTGCNGAEPLAEMVLSDNTHLADCDKSLLSEYSLFRDGSLNRPNEPTRNELVMVPPVAV